MNIEGGPPSVRPSENHSPGVRLILANLKFQQNNVTTNIAHAYK
jgi:hypothetical protein